MYKLWTAIPCCGIPGPEHRANCRSLDPARPSGKLPLAVQKVSPGRCWGAFRAAVKDTGCADYAIPGLSLLWQFNCSYPNCGRNCPDSAPCFSLACCGCGPQQFFLPGDSHPRPACPAREWLFVLIGGNAAGDIASGWRFGHRQDARAQQSESRAGSGFGVTPPRKRARDAEFTIDISRERAPNTRTGPQVKPWNESKDAARSGVRGEKLRGPLRSEDEQR